MLFKNYIINKIKESSREVAVFGGGCFWCTEAVFQMLRGVLSVQPGYAGGSILHPTYEQVSMGRSGHAEVIRIQYDPDLISYSDLLKVFFGTHDPTSLNRQGHDMGSQYRSIILYTSEIQKETAEQFIQDNATSFRNPIVTEVKPLCDFYPAEQYHIDYYKNNSEAPYCQFVIRPKVEKVNEQFKKFLIPTHD